MSNPLGDVCKRLQSFSDIILHGPVIKNHEMKKTFLSRPLAGQPQYEVNIIKTNVKQNPFLNSVTQLLQDRS